MAKYLYRTCPKCKHYLGVVVPEPPGPLTEVSIDARCLRCGLKLAWRVIMGGKSILALLWLVLFLPLYTPSVYPHGGGLDSYGCHHNRKQGGYHCHRAMFEEQKFSSKAELLREPHSGRQLLGLVCSCTRTEGGQWSELL